MTIVRNPVLDHYDRLPEVIARCVDDVAPVEDPAAFSPGFLLPEPDAAVRDYSAVAEVSLLHGDGIVVSPIALRSPDDLASALLATL